MMTLTRSLLVGSVFALAGRFALGCASSDETESSPDGDASVAPGDDASVADPSAPDSDASIDAAPPTCSVDGWCYTTLPAAGSFDASAITTTTDGTRFSLRGVWIAPDHRVWAVSGLGHVLMWDGSAWQVKAAFSNGLRSVWGPSESEIWITGERGLVQHGVVSGSEVTFEPARFTTNTTQTISRIVGTSASQVWLIADGIDGFSNLNRVWRLDPMTGSDPPSFSPIRVPSTLPGPNPNLRISALWTAGSDFWLAGYETTFFGSNPSTFMENLVAMKWSPAPDGGASWEQVPFRRDRSNPIVNATATSDSVHILTIRGDSTSAIAVRVSDDVSKLDAGPNAEDGGITHEGSYAWTEESVADGYGEPVGLWAASRNDVWVVGQYGLVRHFDGTSWKLVRTSLTNATPLLEPLYGIDGLVDASGEQDIWIVGDDVALHRKVKP